jgi:hypothetical protein
MLLITKDNSKTETCYPTMSMILKGLIVNFALDLFYFQQDSLWKSLQIAPHRCRTHDVLDEKALNPKTTRTPLLFSITYPDKNKGNFPDFASNPTMCMKGKDLLASRHFPAISYVIENRHDIELAWKNKGPRTHDVYGGQGLRGKARFSLMMHVIENTTGSSLALKSKGSEPTMCRKQKGLACDGLPSMRGALRY